MANEILQDFAAELKTMESRLDEANELISVMEEAGEDTVQMKADYRATELRINKWKNVLKARGIEVDV